MLGGFAAVLVPITANQHTLNCRTLRLSIQLIPVMPAVVPLDAMLQRRPRKRPTRQPKDGWMLQLLCRV